MSNSTIKLTLADRLIGAVYAPYKTRAIQHRAVQQQYQNLSKRDGVGRKRGSGYTNQPLGPGKIRKLTPHSRRVMIQQSREAYENNALAFSLINRATDNIIGEGMTPKPMSADMGWNAEVAQWWRESYEPDSSGKFTKAELQRMWFRSYLRDGDVGAIMLRRGQLQTIESDYIQSPGDSGDLYSLANNPDVVDGFKVSPAGRLQQAYVASIDASGGMVWPAIDMRNFLFHARHDRTNREAVRGVPALGIVLPLLEHIDGTMEAVVMAHRIAASFGVLIKKNNPGAANNALPSLGSSPNTGDINKAYQIKPGMVEHMNINEEAQQIKPEHPTASFESFMTTLVRFVGVPLGLPLELSLMDFSKTNYSSARASLEQAYRSFRVEQNKFADGWLSKWYRWRLSKAVNMGELSAPPEDFLQHRWMAQPWPYLDPVKDAQGVLAAQDAGMTTLTDELAKRGYEFEEWIEMRSNEIQTASDAGVPLFHSSASRDAKAEGAAPEPAPEPEQEDENTDNPLPPMESDDELPSQE